MKEYELIIESYNPCGGREHGKKELMEIETNDPVAYVKGHAQVTEVEVVSENEDEILIEVNQYGYVKRYTFTEI